MSTLMSLDYSKLFELADPLANRPLRLETYDDDWLLKNNNTWRLFRGQLKLTEPLKLRAYMGGQATDFLWSGLIHVVCVSSRVVDLLREHGITGWDTYPVEVYGRKGEPLPGYHGFAVTGPECRRDRSRSPIVDKPPPVPGGCGYRVYKGLYFDESQWDGSDIFLVEGSKVVTERVYSLFKRAKVSNVRFQRLTELEIHVFLDEVRHWENN